MPPNVLHRVLALAEGHVRRCLKDPRTTLPGMLEMLREECSYYLGYYDSIMDAKGVQSEGISHRGKRYFINNRYRLSNRL